MKLLHELIADKLECADAAEREALLRIPIENIDRWMASGHTAVRRLELWRRTIVLAGESPEGFRDLLFHLRDAGPESKRLRDFSPFAGVLAREERLKADSECAYHF